MTEKEAIEKLKETQDSYLKDELDLAIETVLNLIEKQQNRIDELEKALVDEQLKHTDKINKAIKYIEEETCIDYEREICHEMYEGQIFELIKILEE